MVVTGRFELPICCHPNRPKPGDAQKTEKLAEPAQSMI
jgi:hypothetical protein